MKKAAVIICGVLLLLSVLYFLQGIVKQRVVRDFSSAKNSAANSISPTPYEKVSAVGREKVSKFVPYWTLGNEAVFDSPEMIYFGVAPGREGVSRDDPGYKKLKQFANQTGDKRKYLTLRMLDQEISSDVIESKDLQEKLITDTIEIAKLHGFDGIVLDLEFKALPFDSVIENINGFVSKFYTESKTNNLTFSVLIYGDTFYRVRPFDVKTMAKNSDSIMIMAYDFHKAGGSPGPNFPLRGSEKFGYDFQEMISDFLRVVPKEKLTVVFGMFGYDWAVDDNNESTGTGKALSLLQMEQKFVEDCIFSDCSVRRDGDALETMVTYKDQEGNKHIVWFEDLESVKQKQKFLRERGINAFSYWAHSFY